MGFGNPQPASTGFLQRTKGASPIPAFYNNGIAEMQMVTWNMTWRPVFRAGILWPIMRGLNTWRIGFGEMLYGDFQRLLGHDTVNF